MDLFGLFAKPLGWFLAWIYSWTGGYFLAIFLFTLLVRMVLFPLSLKSQKTSAERARIAPRLERLQKKYGQDKQKMQQKQMELYEKEGVSMTGGCLPMILQMLVLFSIIAVIYKPLTYLNKFPPDVLKASVTAVKNPADENGKEIVDGGKVAWKEMTGYYEELGLLRHMETYKAGILNGIKEVAPSKEMDYYNKMLKVRSEFSIGGQSLLDVPWQGFDKPNWLWLIVLLSGATALGSSLISMHFMKATNATAQPGQGCSNNMLLYGMPLFSLFITFTVPGGVGLYWIFSNLIMTGQTVLLNVIYNPAKIRAAAEAEYEERRQKRAEDKKRLAEARAREEEAHRQQAKLETQQKEQARLQASQKTPPPVTKNPNKLKKREAIEENPPSATEEEERTES